MKEVVNKLKLTAVSSLTRMVLTALNNARLQIEAQAIKFSGTQLPPIKEESQGIAERFMQNLNTCFDDLTSIKVKKDEFDDYNDLSLIDHDYLEAIIAMEGMVNHARNNDIQQYISFTTRLNTLFPNMRIDETNNPLDPEQIGDCFNEAVRPLGLKAHYLLTIYREFNKAVFHNIEDVLEEANEVMIEMGILPKLDIKARNKEQYRARREAAETAAKAQAESKAATSTPPSREIESNKVASAYARNESHSEAIKDLFDAENIETIPEEPASPPPAPPKENVEMFAMMQRLIKDIADKKNGSLTLPAASIEAASSDAIMAEQQDLRVQQTQLLEMLTAIQSTLNSSESLNSEAHPASAANSNITDTISETLSNSSKAGKIGPLDAQSADVINLVTLLYEAIWNDDAVPVVMKELIGRTQISTMKVALSDTSFFEDEQHPARVLLNDFAKAGIAWTVKDSLAEDPLYNKIKELVERLLAEKNATNPFLESLINDLRLTRNSLSKSDAALEQRIRESEDHNERLDDVHAFVREKVGERILVSNLDPSIRTLLNTHFHEFLVKLILNEGPGGSSWKPVMSTIDVMLWTVKAEKQPGDRERFEKINPRLMDNLEKALEIGGASKTKITKIMRQLKQVQQYSFHKAEAAADQAASGINSTAGVDITPLLAPRRYREPPPLPRDDPFVRQVDKLSIGVWLEFKGIGGQPVRCTLAAKIESIDKLFFVNLQGQKVVELTSMRLARELKAGSVKIVSDGSLVDRAMESVLSNLRGSPSVQSPTVSH